MYRQFTIGSYTIPLYTYTTITTYMYIWKFPKKKVLPNQPNHETILVLKPSVDGRTPAPPWMVGTL